IQNTKKRYRNHLSALEIISVGNNMSVSLNAKGGQSKEELEAILQEREPVNPELQKVVSAMYSVLENYRDKNYSGGENHGIIFYVNHDPNSGLKVNGKNATYLHGKEGNYKSIYTPEGKQMLEKILGDYDLNDGAVELQVDGSITSCRRMLRVAPDDVAEKIGLGEKGEGASYHEWGFKKPVFTKHLSAKASTVLDPSIYIATLSSEGDIRVMNNNQIISSPYRDELPERLRHKQPEPRDYMRIAPMATARAYL
ncbi:hypothetical protein JXB28_04765, partial [Candidatus Woesearchaeota archaeon]|nr:hypothetical protein [Candidatus Woesearchaeota archaeon]